MKFVVELSDSASYDIIDAVGWYNFKKAGLGNKLSSEIRRKTKLISENPKLFRIRYFNVRTAILDTFPFMIHYKVYESEKLIVVVAVLHTSRDPGNWISRT